MNGVNFRYGKYMNGSCFSLGLVYEWGGVRGLQPHIRTQNHGKLPPRANNQPKSTVELGYMCPRGLIGPPAVTNLELKILP